MNVSRRVLIALVMAIALECQGSAGALGQDVSNDTSEKAFLSGIRPVLFAARLSARVYFHAVCPSADGDVPFPQINLMPVRSGRAGVKAIREMLQGNDDVKITEREHIVRIEIGDVPHTLLQTKLSSLVLTPHQQYNAVLAIAAIENAKEVAAIKSRLGITAPTTVFNITLAAEDDREPRLPNKLTNVTVDRALDLVAKTFGQIILYGDCGQPRRYLIANHGLYVN